MSQYSARYTTAKNLFIEYGFNGKHAVSIYHRRYFFEKLTNYCDMFTVKHHLKGFTAQINFTTVLLDYIREPESHHYGWENLRCGIVKRKAVRWSIRVINLLMSQHRTNVRFKAMVWIIFEVWLYVGTRNFRWNYFHKVYENFWGWCEKRKESRFGSGKARLFL